MAAFKRTQEPGNTLTLESGAGARRLKKLENQILADLGIDELPKSLRVLARRAAELTLVAEELSDQLVAGKPISVELIGRNADRFQRTMKELREQAVGVRIRERNAIAMADRDDDEDDDDFPSEVPLPRRPITETIIDERPRRAR